MTPISQYIQEAKPMNGDFNTMDAFVLSQFAYLPYGTDMAGYEGFCINPYELKIGAFASMLLSEKYKEILIYRFGKEENAYRDYKEFCYALSDSKRYAGLEISSFSFENTGHSQYAALCIRLNDAEKKTAVVCYRGTDGSYGGWYENFQMLEQTVDAQRFASSYLGYAAKSFDEIYVTGHSKGGNLAVFSAVDMAEFYWHKIMKVYNFDGPGFNNDFLDKNKPSIALTKHKTTAYLPENSIVGCLLFGQNQLYKDIAYVEADFSQGLLHQHSLFTWKIKNGGLVPAQRSGLSILLDEGLDYIVNNASPQQMSFLVNLFLSQID